MDHAQKLPFKARLDSIYFFDSNMDPNVTGLTSCMVAGMEGCDESLKNQTQLILDGYIQLFADYTQMCAGRYNF